MTDATISEKPTCLVANCGRNARRRGLCATHYAVILQGGDPHTYVIHPYGDLPAKFFKCVVKGPGCWAWTGWKDNDGYGKFRVGKTKTPAHRFSYEHHKGPIPDGLLVCHSCDNPECTNPEHLWIGTHKDNIADRDQKGRGNPPIGERAQAAMLTESQVLDIRKRVAAGERQYIVAASYGVCKQTVCSIVNRKTWRHI